MLLCLLFICFLFGRSVKSQSTSTWTSQIKETTTTTTEASTIRDNEPGVQLLASPDYPVSAGQRVHLQCKLLSVSTDDVDWSWQFLKGQTWKEVNSDGELILTKPEESGLYRCQAKTGSNWSQNHTVSIVAIKASMEVGENLGIAACVFSLLVLITIIAGLLLLVWKRIGNPKTPSSPAVKVNDPGPKVVPKGGCTIDESDGDLYMNYSTGKSSDYTDLDPSSMSADNEYSTV